MAQQVVPVVAGAPVVVAAQPVMGMPVAVGVPLIAPAFAAVPAVAVPEAWGAHLSPQVWGILAASESLTVRQHVKLLPKNCCSCPPCVKQENTYTVFAGIGQDSQAALFRVDEISDDWNRCCCTPTHPVKLEIRQNVPAGYSGPASEFAHGAAEINADWGRFTGGDRHQAEKAVYEQVPVAMTIVRDGSQLGSCGCNKCVGCPVVSDLCADNFVLVAGRTVEEDKKEIGKKLIDRLPSTIGGAKVPYSCLNKYSFTPALHIRQGEAEPFAKMEGPCCFGGCSELCCDFSFPISSINGPGKAGDLAKIVKQKPSGMAAAFKEVISSSDTFTLTFQDKSLTPEQKALFLSSLLLTDYTYFETPSEMCGTDEDGKCYILLCKMYCCGCLVPIKLKQENNGGG